MFVYVSIFLNFDIDISRLIIFFTFTVIYLFCKESIRVLRSGSSKEIVENLKGRFDYEMKWIENFISTIWTR